MAQFCIEVAGQVAYITSLFESTPHYFAKYRADRDADFSIAVRPEDLRFEQADADAEAEEDGFRQRNFPDPFLERAAIHRKFAEHLLSRNIFPVHGSTVAVDGRGYLFTARSGTGKSTHTRLWMQQFGGRAVMVNDDRPFLEITESGIIAHGCPWSGKHGLDTNISVPLAGICLLERGSENVIRRATSDELSDLLKGYRPKAEADETRYLQLLRELTEKVPLWHMYCTKDIDAAHVAFDAMSE